MLIIIGMLSVGALIAFIHSKFISVNHFFKIGCLLAAIAHLNDAVSDILFAAQIRPDSLELWIIFICSIVFVVVPAAISIFQLQRALAEWRQNDELKAWLSKYVSFLYLFSILSGSSFVAVQVCTSGAFSHRLTNMPMNKHNVLRFKSKILYWTVVLENFPQLIIQCIYLWETYDEE